MKEEENVALDYEKNYYMMMDEMNKKLEYQKEEYEKEKKELEKELQFYKKNNKECFKYKRLGE